MTEEPPQHQRQADELERDADDMEERAEDLDEAISDARKDWEGKLEDPAVPGAVKSDSGDGGDPPPEQQYPAKGD
jgi:hypothetical protein